MLRYPNPELARQQRHQFVYVRYLPPLALAADPMNRKAAVIQRTSPPLPRSRPPSAVF